MLFANSAVFISGSLRVSMVGLAEGSKCSQIEGNMPNDIVQSRAREIVGFAGSGPIFES